MRTERLPGRLVNGPTPITYGLIAACVGVSLVGFWALRKRDYQDYFLFRASEVAKGKGLVGALVSHFSHADFGHLFLNMLALYFFGPSVEAALGPLPYLAVFAVSGLLGSVGIFLMRRKKKSHSALGASGAIAGVVFASVIVAPTSSIYLLLIPVPIPAPIFAVGYLVVSMFMMGRGDHVAHEAHIGGAIGGFALAGALYPPHFEPLTRAVTALVS